MAQLSEGVTIEEIDDPSLKEFHSKQKGFICDFVRFQPYNQVLPRCYEDWEKKNREFECYEDDVWVASFPKCGKLDLGGPYISQKVFCVFFLIFASISWSPRHNLDGRNGLAHFEQPEL